MSPMLNSGNHPRHQGSIQKISRTCLIVAAAMLLIGAAAVNPSPRPQSPSDLTPIPAGRKAETIAIISIDGPIDGVTTRSIERRLREANEAGCDAVVIELDTPGGDLMATFDILELIRNQAPANTVAWVRPKAFSAGTIIALATREIIITPTGVFGDAAPIQGMPVVGLRQLPAAERAKIEAPLLSEVVYDARRQGWDEKLVQAFVAVDVELWLIQNRTNGDRLFVDAAEYERIFGDPPVPTRLTRLPAPPARDQLSELLGGSSDPDEPVPTVAEREETIEFLQDFPSKRPTLGPEDAPDWVLLGQVVSPDELLVLRADEAAAYGFTSGEIDNETELASFFGASRIIRFDESWSERLVRFMTLWPVRAILITVMLVGFFIEIAAPGYGAFGLVSLVSLALLLGAPLLAGMADWWTVAAVLLGLMFVALELFILPGFGVAGLLGAVFIFGGLVGTFIGGRPFEDSMREDLVRGLLATSIGFLGAGVGIWLLWRNLPRLSLARGLILAEEVGVIADDPTGRAVPSAPVHNPTSIAPGTVGITATPLRTSGRVRIGDRLVDAQSAGAYIERDTKVRVISSDELGIKVEELDS
ncbi:MAG: NfeD family protein [Phycisphaerales bacterium]|jgi:membrane-bound serine protease (ClpP class)|nr:NfeD family protein [Phycisphaerales bacterium]